VDSTNLVAKACGVRQLDPAPFLWLQGAIALYVAVMSTLVLVTQNRQNRYTEQRDYLELQVNLLAEQKIAKIISLLEELRKDSPALEHRRDSETEDMKRPVDPKAVFSALEHTLEHCPSATGGTRGDAATRSIPQGDNELPGGRERSNGAGLEVSQVARERAT
jgi:uncharacterized membrane protein